MTLTTILLAIVLQNAVPHAAPARLVATARPEARAGFEEGLQLHFAGNDAGALFHFEAAVRADPMCALCFWGIALTSGPAAAYQDGGPETERARRAIARALLLTPEVTEPERALIRALYARHSAATTAGGAEERDRAYASAMAEVARRHPNIADIYALHAEAILAFAAPPKDGGPATADGRAAAGALALALRLDPSHRGARRLSANAAVAALRPGAL